MSHRLALLLGLLLAVCTTTARAAAPYPLYFIDEHDEKAPMLSQADAKVLAENFVFAHGRFRPEEIKMLHEANPKFIILQYVLHQWNAGGEGIRDAEKHRMDLLYYRVAKLSAALPSDQTEIVLAPVDLPLNIKASTINGDYSDTNDAAKIVTWLRIGDELMRLNEWDEASRTAKVTRGWDGTKAADHAASDAVLTVVRTQRNPSMKGNIRYANDPARPYRWELSLQSALTNVKNGFDGTWYDLVSSFPFQPGDILGNKLPNVWDCQKNQNYERDDYSLACDKGLNYVQTEYKKQMGQWPVIFINNMQRSMYYPGKGDVQRFLKATPEKPRPVDGYCVESYAGNFKEQDFANWMKGGPAAPPSFYGEKEWKEMVSVLMDASQHNYAADPFMCNAGWKNRMYEHLDQKFKDRFENWAFASYLLAIERKNGKTANVFGTNPFYWEGNQRKVKLQERYTWDLGDPAETHQPAKMDLYKPQGHSTYVRKYQKGIVLVNPSEKEDAGIALNRSYYDPETQRQVTQVSMPAQSGKILLIKD